MVGAFQAFLTKVMLKSMFTTISISIQASFYKVGGMELMGQKIIFTVPEKYSFSNLTK